MDAAEAEKQVGRRFTWPWFLVAVIVYLGIIQGLGQLIGVDASSSDSRFPTTESLVRNALIPIGASIVFVAALVTWLGWWGVVLRYGVPVRRWVRWVPISMLLATLVAMNYGHLGDQSGSLVVCLLLLGLFVGVGEELMFCQPRSRCISRSAKARKLRGGRPVTRWTVSVVRSSAPPAMAWSMPASIAANSAGMSAARRSRICS